MQSKNWKRKITALKKLFNKQIKHWDKDNVIRWKLRFTLAVILFSLSAMCFMPFSLFSIEQYNLILSNLFEPIVAFSVLLLGIYAVYGFLSLYYAQKVWKSL